MLPAWLPFNGSPVQRAEIYLFLGEFFVDLADSPTNLIGKKLALGAHSWASKHVADHQDGAAPAKLAQGEGHQGLQHPALAFADSFSLLQENRETYTYRRIWSSLSGVDD